MSSFAPNLEPVSRGGSMQELVGVCVLIVWCRATSIVVSNWANNYDLQEQFTFCNWGKSRVYFGIFCATCITPKICHRKFPVILHDLIFSKVYLKLVVQISLIHCSFRIVWLYIDSSQSDGSYSCIHILQGRRQDFRWGVKININDQFPININDQQYIYWLKTIMTLFINVNL